MQSIKEELAHKNSKDLTGKKFGEWTVLYRGPNSPGKNGRTRYFCLCSCGKEVLVVACNLSLGKSKGCISCSTRRKSNYHGMSGSKTYSVYTQMVERCHNESHKYYDYYGGRGIYVCIRWQESFVNFLEDMGEAPEGLSIDRIDNSKGYSKNNCRWATKTEQQRNRRNSIQIGETHNEWRICDRLPKKQYKVVCLSCSRCRLVKSCNFRRLSKCKCSEGGVL